MCSCGRPYSKLRHGDGSIDAGERNQQSGDAFLLCSLQTPLAFRYISVIKHFAFVIGDVTARLNSWINRLVVFTIDWVFRAVHSPVSLLISKRRNNASLIPFRRSSDHIIRLWNHLWDQPQWHQQLCTGWWGRGGSQETLQRPGPLRDVPASGTHDLHPYTTRGKQASLFGHILADICV